MTISDKDLFMAILSMDSYNRGYESGIALPETTVIGNAVILATPSSINLESWQAAGFYAAAYTTQWGTVISYRGTNVDSLAAARLDIENGWAFAVGDFTADQLELSTAFLEQIVNSSGPAITLIGHSQSQRTFGGIEAANDDCQRKRGAA